MKFITKSKLYTYDTEITFGRHAGKTVDRVLHTNPQWLLWAYNNIDGFDLDTNVVDDALMFSKEYDKLDNVGFMDDPYDY